MKYKSEKGKRIALGVHEARLSNGNTLANTGSTILEEWDYELNTITPNDVTPRSHTKVIWKCRKCGYRYPAAINNRMGGSGCPCCAGQIVVEGINDLASKCPDLLKEWDYEKNIGIDPKTIHFSAKKKTWWKCKYGHSYPALVSDRYRKGVGCSVCSRYYRTSFPEQALFFYVKKYFPDAINSYKPGFLKPSEIDIFVPAIRVGIEFDGQRYHKNIDRDIKKDRICEEHGIRLIRVREPKCIKYDRKDETIILKDLSFDELSNAISKVLSYLEIKNSKVDVEIDKNEIITIFHEVAVSDSIAILYPELAEEWADENGDLRPENVPAHKNKNRYYWKCKKCTSIWKAGLTERINGSKCPVCQNKSIVVGINDLATTHPDLVQEWCYDLNSPRSPQDYTYGSNDDAYWKCRKCGTIWSCRINRRINGYGCPKCAKENRKKKVYQYDLNKTLIAEYTCLSEAAKSTGISSGAISTACNMKRGSNVCRGFIWSYEKF